jgi:hypothetical protein
MNKKTENRIQETEEKRFRGVSIVSWVFSIMPLDFYSSFRIHY